MQRFTNQNFMFCQNEEVRKVCIIYVTTEKQLKDSILTVKLDSLLPYPF